VFPPRVKARRARCGERLIPRAPLIKGHPVSSAPLLSLSLSLSFFSSGQFVALPLPSHTHHSTLPLLSGRERRRCHSDRSSHMSEHKWRLLALPLASYRDRQIEKRRDGAGWRNGGSPQKM